MTDYKGPNAFSNGLFKTANAPKIVAPYQRSPGGVIRSNNGPAFNNRFPKSRYRGGGQGGPQIVSSDENLPDWLPDGAVAFIDAINEHYWDGTETTLDAMISDITRDEDGLIAAPGGFSAIGGFFDILAWPFTAVFTSNNSNINTLSYETADPLAYAFMGVHNANATTDDFDSHFLEVTGVDPDANAKIAATFSLSKIAISVEGAAVVADDSQTLSMPAFTAIKVASFNGDTARIPTITVYPPVADAALPALSTL